MTNTLLHLQDLEVGYMGRPILPSISAQIEFGQLWGIAGSNGSGKSTLLKTMLGLLPKLGGEIVEQSELRVGYVPQRMSLDLTMPARAIDVVRGGAARGWSFVDPLHTYREKETIDLAMEQTRIHDIARQQLAELSEGQKQRVLMARALVCNPNLLVLDEPTSAMDNQTEMEMLELLNRLRKERNLSVVLVSHNLMGMASVATHALLLDREHQLIIEGDIRDVAVHHEVHEHFGRLLRSVVEDRFGPIPDPEECHDCDH
ncbi:MAG: ATP-binding cassette domain-containing protein [Myxococcota bacterium]|nr:ATP-binding cassette domain-containing protein [Myxococcota bacterium]